MSGTDANVFITLFGEHGASKKIHLVDPSSNKKCFEKNSKDNFRVQMYSIGELRRIRYGSEVIRFNVCLLYMADLGFEPIWTQHMQT